MEALDVLAQYFGFRKFLDAQDEVIEAILSGEDTLVVMPTGGGKSLCYQLPALMLEGVTVVVSPLIALMKDQVDGLQRKGVSATMINSMLAPSEQHDRLRRMREGEYTLVYISPERFRNRSFTETLAGLKIALFAIDEAHCLSQWGHDFRPDYLRLGESIKALGRPQVAAFTATATPEVREDILKHLGLGETQMFVAGFARPNLRFSITHAESEAEKFDRVRALIDEHKTGIIYCATRKRVGAVSEMLSQWKVSSVPYHGGMDDKAREEAQNEFLERRKSVAVATNAFGMGIDRSDIRFVVHFELPGSVEAYYQEAGRAGRDGEPAVCELLFNFVDTRVQDFFIDGNNPSTDLIREVYEEMRRARNEQEEVVWGIKDLADSLGKGTNQMAVGSALSILGRLRYVERFDIPGQRKRGTRMLQPEVSGRELDLDDTALAEKEARDRGKLKAMVQFAYSKECRQSWILRYFGEEEPERCGNCDSCRNGDSHVVREPEAEELLLVKKALSGVARMSFREGKEGWRGRYGRGRIIQMLLGSRSKEIIDPRLDQLSTYGILKEEGSAYLNELFRELQHAGLLETSGGEFPLTTLTKLGDRVMKGNATFRIAWPERSTSTPATRGGRARSLVARDEEIEYDTGLFEVLKKKREELMRKLGGVPAYTIFPNVTLKFMARDKPLTVEEGKQIRGVGDHKAKRFLPSFVEVIRKYEAGS